MVFTLSFFSPFAFHFGVKRRLFQDQEKSNNNCKFYFLFGAGVQERPGKNPDHDSKEKEKPVRRRRRIPLLSYFLLVIITTGKRGIDRESETASERDFLCKIDQLL
jgi:hypothetical protein